MRKRKILAYELQRLAPPMPGAFEQKALQTLNKLSYIEEEPVVKKLSVGLVFAIVIMLVAVTALAVALLSAREIVEEYGVPIAQQSEGEAYSAEETNILLELARENGIEFSENGMRNINRFLSRGEGYYKQELLMELAKAEFGSDPASWTLEEQKWFDDVCVATGIFDQPQKALPGENEITQEQAVRIAEDYIHAQYGSSINLNDAKVYNVGIQYIDGNEDGAYPGCYWTILYRPLSVETTGYDIYINSQGEVWNTSVRPGITGVQGASAAEIGRKFTEVTSEMEYNWSQPELQAYREAMVQSSTPNSWIVLCMQRTFYPDISPVAMSREEAGMLAVKALKLNLDGQAFADALWGGVYIGDDPNPVWKVCLGIEKSECDCDYIHPSYIPHNDVYYIEVDSITGEIKNIYEYEPSPTRLCSPIVLQKVLDEINRTWIEEIPPSVG